MSFILYRDGYKYQLESNYVENIGVNPAVDITTDYIDLTVNGVLTVKKGYAWDGPSGPTIDTKNFMRGALVHDALYQLMRNDFLKKSSYRKVADELLYTMCREDGMSWIRASWVCRAVRTFGDASADPSSKKQVCQAPD